MPPTIGGPSRRPPGAAIALALRATSRRDIAVAKEGCRDASPACGFASGRGSTPSSETGDGRFMHGSTTDLLSLLRGPGCLATVCSAGERLWTLRGLPRPRARAGLQAPVTEVGRAGASWIRSNADRPSHWTTEQWASHGGAVIAPPRLSLIDQSSILSTVEPKSWPIQPSPPSARVRSARGAGSCRRPTSESHRRSRPRAPSCTGPRGRRRTG